MADETKVEDECKERDSEFFRGSLESAPDAVVAAEVMTAPTAPSEEEEEEEEPGWMRESFTNAPKPLYGNQPCTPIQPRVTVLNDTPPPANPPPPPPRDALGKKLHGNFPADVSADVPVAPAPTVSGALTENQLRRLGSRSNFSTISLKSVPRSAPPPRPTTRPPQHHRENPCIKNGCVVQ